MGRNVDLKELLNLEDVKCICCGESLKYLDEIDMDCDLMTNNLHPNYFKLLVDCFECNTEQYITFIVRIGKRAKK